MLTCISLQLTQNLHCKAFGLWEHQARTYHQNPIPLHPLKWTQVSSLKQGPSPEDILLLQNSCLHVKCLQTIPPTSLSCQCSLPTHKCPIIPVLLPAVFQNLAVPILDHIIPWTLDHVIPWTSNCLHGLATLCSSIHSEWNPKELS